MDAALASVPWARRRNRQRWCSAYAGICVLGTAVAAMAMRSGPGVRPVAFTLLVLGAVAILSRPLLGVHLTVFFGLLGDAQIAWWYPFTKNLSSTESVLYVHDAVVVSPLELFLVLTVLAWGLQVLGGRPLTIRRGPLFWPLAAFTAFLLLALAHGVATGGNTVVALWEVRPLFYLPLVFLLATNLFTQRAHYDALMWTIMAAVTLEGLHSLYVMRTLAGAAAERAEMLGYLEHSASLHFNTVFVLLAAAWLFRRGSPSKRLLLPFAAAAIAVPYLTAERRSAVVALVGAGILLSVFLFRERRGAFLVVVPVATVVAVAYLGVFWNAEGGVGFPAQAVKSVLAPESLSAADHSSNLYRQVETYNLVATIRSSPVTGLGFGHPFHQVIGLPYIPFVWAEYLPHNAVLWIWINTGIGGFLAMLYLLAVAIRTGTGAAVRLAPDDHAALVITAVLFVVMYGIYAYVDIAWDAQSMLYLGVALATIDHLEALPARSVGDPT